MATYPSSGLFRPVEDGAYAAQDAILTGDITLAEDVSIWFGSVLRGDDAPLVIGRRTNIQDLTMVHADPGTPNRIGEECTIGHRAVLHGAEVGDRCLIGIGAVLLAGSKIGEESIIAAGAVVKEGAVIPPRSLVVGVPGKIAREVMAAHVQLIRKSAESYVKKTRLYLP